MNRRTFVSGLPALIAVAATDFARSDALAQAALPHLDDPVPFSPDWLIQQAKDLASKDYTEPDFPLPGDLAKLSYDRYRDIRYRSEARVWAGSGRPFMLDLFHRGFIYNDHVTISLLENGQARRIRYTKDLFDFGASPQPPEDADLGFSGFRVRYPINTPDVWDEFLVFQGATYFRAVAQNQLYGISARGLAINTATPEGEEFPVFTNFWIETPAPETRLLNVYALLDSPSTTGAYRFSIQPGAETVMDVQATLFPRVDIDHIGLAPLSSMFLFDAMNRGLFDDFRPSVHDSNGLLMLTGRGEWVWRPLANPAELQLSAFADQSPRGFGLMQRTRSFDDFKDLEARYERRPSLWIEPLGDWGKGQVVLLEIPVEMEIHDNISVFWRPAEPIPAEKPWTFQYRMRWSQNIEHELLATVDSRAGLTSNEQRRVFVVDFRSAKMPPLDQLAMEVNASAGEVVHPVLQANAPDGTIRASFQLDPGSAALSELRLRLTANGQPASETWLYRWTKR
ncbi:glucan biosynthesis protein [Propylenella binzhouense]|uniref:Glucan biosynthesis protein G n=1 Tax=Propylenella binzhouense TaxID=2555902 RepID=A0A964T1L8_9HYPH|nr:glucan biosynthesis protein G [Propylenella binzhouense]MYZ46711.1 glucan biosynthesis protein G [Propylenella binzhouense]